jgi:PAS domain S-box-containing protein
MSCVLTIRQPESWDCWHLNLYISSAQRFSDTSSESIQLIKELSDPRDGLENLFEHTTVALQNETAAYAYPKELLEKMLLSSKDYLITCQRHFMQSSFNILTILQKAIGNQPSMGDNRRRKVLHLLVQWQETAEKILAVDISIKSKINDFSLQTEATDPVSSVLILQAKEDVGHAQLQILQAHRFAVIIMAVITLAGLLLAVIIARILNNSITKNIIKLTRTAEEFQQGNLEVTSCGEGQDELGQLARTFNTMAARIKELVDNLELRIDERTKELTESEMRFRTIVENTTHGILITDQANMKFLYANSAAARMLNYDSPEELVGKEVADINPEAERQSIQTTFTQMVEGKTRLLSNAPCLRKNGTLFYADIVTGEVNFAGKPCLAGFLSDTTDKKHLQAQLERARKMEAIGLLAGGVAHDLNNILSGIVSYPELLLLQLPPDSALRRPLNAIHESGKRVAAVVSDLLTVARGVASTRETTNLNNPILDYLASPEHCEIRASHPHILCRKDLESHLANISCSAIHIKKCLLNLMLNAMEAMPDAGSITISTRNQEIAGDNFKIAGISPGRYVILTVADTGHGIREEDLEHIFEPFYTKKVMGKSGTGLGLAVAWNSVQDHGGTITVDTGETGTAFQLFFPATQQQLPIKDAQPTVEEMRGDGEEILVVDDEPQQLDITSRILQTLNYRVHCAGSGKEAIDYMKKGRADLILLDMIMAPGLNGLQTFERILQFHSGQKTLIVSGFAESSNVQTAQTLGARGFIKKPFSIEQLGQAVKNELHREEAQAIIGKDPWCSGR